MQLCSTILITINYITITNKDSKKVVLIDTNKTEVMFSTYVGIQNYDDDDIMPYRICFISSSVIYNSFKFKFI